MSRYIDADDLIKEIFESKHSYVGTPTMVYQHDLMCDNAISWADGAETADVIKPVYCRACKHYLTPDNGSSYCAITHIRKGPEDYCSDGKENTK